MNPLLQALTQHEFSQHAGLTLAHALWQGVIVALLLAVVLQRLRHASAASRHTAACLALLVLLFAPILTFCHLGRALPPIQDTSLIVTGADTLSGVKPRPFTASASPTLAPRAHLSASNLPGNSSSSSTIPWHAWVVAIWLGGMAALTLWHGVGWLLLQRLRRDHVSPWTGDFAALAARMAKRLRLRAMPHVLWSQRVAGPVAFGCWRTVVLFPASLATGFTMAQIEMVLAHEFAHLRRHDYLINLCQTVATTVLFFHPAVWWINRVILREREHACDDLAVAAVGDAPGYARTLVSLAEQEFTSAASPSLAPAALRDESALRRRIERLLLPAPARQSRRFWPALFVLILVALAWQTLPTQPSVAQGEIPRTMEPVRGDIRDRNGVLLASDDRESAQIWFRLSDVAIAYARAHSGAFPRRQREPSAADKVSPAAAPAKAAEVPDIVTMFNEVVVNKLSAADLLQPRITPEDEKTKGFIADDLSIGNGLPPKLAALDLIFPYNSASMRRGYEGKEALPLPPSVAPADAPGVLAKYGNELWCYHRDLTPEEAKRALAIAGQIPGMSVRTVKMRRYPFAALASHVLGYITRKDDSEPDLNTGVYGVEKMQDIALQATLPGEGHDGRRGSDVYLTLDARHQTVVEQTLRNATPAIGRASVVLMAVDTGDVLAMASVPSFNPNDFIPSISRKQFDEYKNDETSPLLNRAVVDYTPGSTFLIVTGLAAILTGHENDQYNCPGGITYGNKYLQCWVGQKGETHGPFGLRGALVESCGSYFYQLGNAVHMEAIEKAADLCGFGKHTGIGLPEERSGIFPSREWWTTNRPRDPFTAATIANISIGQGAVQATPLQLATLAATVANGGTVWQPRLVDRVAPAGDASIAVVQPRNRTADLREHGLTPTGLTALRGAMEDVVSGDRPRAAAARSPMIRIAGSTGTAQNWRKEAGNVVKDNLTWFICYAPAEKPRWALAVMVQGGKGGGVSAAPIAKHILEQVNAIESGTLEVEPQAMPARKGTFEPVEQVTLPPWQSSQR